MSLFFEFQKYSADFNMEFDNFLLEHCEAHDIDMALRFYGWSPPAVTLGRNQTKFGIDEEFCRQNNISIARRTTGGRALLHADEITYCVVLKKSLFKNSLSLFDCYKEITDVLVGAFADEGVNLEYNEYRKAASSSGYCMNLATVADVNCNGKKFIGSAQFRKNTHILQHGSIPLSFDRKLLSEIFVEEKDFGHIIALDEISSSLNLEQVMLNIKKGFEEKFKSAKCK
ncbi:MAG: lipoate--protein ligase family protein [Candidatus Gastranaerophilales bacterium]|nr:lipoate--protein ligase family protein [Candidatus Gastranaerophilales bacterium]